MNDMTSLRARFRAPGIKWSSTSLTARVRRYTSAEGPRRVLVLDFALPEGGRAAVEIRPSAALDLTNLIVDTLEEDGNAEAS